MKGITRNLSTKVDWLNSVEYSLSTGTGKDVMISRLIALKENTKMNVLKKASEKKDVDDLTPEDFEAVDDPNSEIIRLGFTVEEIDKLIGALK